MLLDRINWILMLKILIECVIYLSEMNPISKIIPCFGKHNENENYFKRLPLFFNLFTIN